MKFAYSMLLDFVKTDLTADQAGDLLTMAGFELEEIEVVNGEQVLDIKVMSNRGDGLSVFGLAREVLAKDAKSAPTELFIHASSRFNNATTLQHVKTEPLATIETSDCTRYACLMFTDLKKSPTPLWIQDRLTKAGMRPISLLVDLTNYVMLEMGQPLHAFDFDKLKGGRIVVRKAKEGEKIKTLDEQERELKPFMTMICDAERPVAVAGVMGGLETEVSGSTQRMLLESAHFVNTSVRKTRRALGMSTEASYRFERSVDPEGVVSAIRRFAQLFADSGGGEVSAEITDIYPSPTKRHSIRLRLGRSEMLLGMPISESDATRYLTQLGFECNAEGNATMAVTAPTWRPDVLREEDVIEELGRVHGYERIPTKLPSGSTTMGGTSGYEAWEDKIRAFTLRLGFSQMISHTLRDASPLDDPRLEKIGPRGINDPEMMWLRSSILSSLADAAKRNGAKDVHLFELGQVFGTHNKQIAEKTVLGFLSQGAVDSEWWGAKSSQGSSFFSLKGTLQALFQRTLSAVEFRTPAHPDPRFHPTRQADIYASVGFVGMLGQIDPTIAEKVGLPNDTILAEIDLTTAFKSAREQIHVRQISRNPAVRRDIAFLIEKSVPFEQVRNAVMGASGDLLEDHWLFDIYEGKGVPEGKHSLAIALQLRKIGANLTDDEANQVREKVVSALGELGATPR
jgi:phenylalanyl-tRNA synthetase beta chain